MAVLSVTEITLAIILGVLAAIVYSLRVLVLLERRMARVDENLQRIVMKVAHDEELIEKKLGIKTSSKAKPKKRKSRK
jgi:hypothetical protein